jgi:hypothetical protein
MFDSELFGNATLEELKCGYIEKDDFYICLLCGKKIEKGIIYPEDNTLYEAGRYIRIHIEKVHQSVFEYLLQLDKDLIGLTDHQKGLLRLFHQGRSDSEVQKEMGIGSVSTVRNHRFALKEKERQSKLFLAVMELSREKDKHAPTFVDLPKTAQMTDDRYHVTREENEELLRKYFPEGTDGPLKTFSIQEKHKLVVLREIAGRFESGRIYSEKEVNGILKAAYDDHVTLRRYLIEYGFLDRKLDGSQYWLKNEIAGKEEDVMDRKKELKQQYKEIKIQAGVYQITNVTNGKICIIATRDLKTMNGKRFELEMGSSKNRPLQKEWNEYGKDAFTFEVLEILEKKEEGFFDLKDALKKLEEKWLDKLQPYGERGYNKQKSE